MSELFSLVDPGRDVDQGQPGHQLGVGGGQGDGGGSRRATCRPPSRAEGASAADDDGDVVGHGPRIEHPGVAGPVGVAVAGQVDPPPGAGRGPGPRCPRCGRSALLRGGRRSRARRSPRPARSNRPARRHLDGLGGAPSGDRSREGRPRWRSRRTGRTRRSGRRRRARSCRHPRGTRWPMADDQLGQASRRPPGRACRSPPGRPAPRTGRPPWPPPPSVSPPRPMFEHGVVDHLRHLLPTAGLREPIELRLQLLPSFHLEDRPVGRRRGVEGEQPAAGGPGRLQFGLVPTATHDHLPGDREVRTRPAGPGQAPVDRRERALPEVGGGVERHDQQAVSHLGGQARPSGGPARRGRSGASRRDGGRG